MPLTCRRNPHAATAFHSILDRAKVEQGFGPGLTGSGPGCYNTRVIPNCWVTGQGAGVAAALAVENAVSPGKVPIETLQRALTDSGVEL